MKTHVTGNTLRLGSGKKEVWSALRKINRILQASDFGFGLLRVEV